MLLCSTSMKADNQGGQKCAAVSLPKSVRETFMSIPAEQGAAHFAVLPCHARAIQEALEREERRIETLGKCLLCIQCFKGVHGQDACSQSL